MNRDERFDQHRNMQADQENHDLLNQIRILTENQNSLMQTINAMRQRVDDPFMNFKTPDPIKNLSTFNGRRSEALAWIEDTQQTLNLFDGYQHDPSYPQIIRAVKCKIIGDAKDVLIAAGNPNDWPSIKNILLQAYGDRRDLTSHIQSLFYAKRATKHLQIILTRLRVLIQRLNPQHQVWRNIGIQYLQSTHL